MSARGWTDELEVTVRDTGIGIAPEDQARIFEAFQQGGRGAKTEEGTGLGLTLSRKIVELHGGRMWVESEVGRGSTFAFTLPHARRATETRAIAPAAPAPRRPRRSATAAPTVLVVEDEEHSVDLLSLYLTGAGLRRLRSPATAGGTRARADPAPGGNRARHHPPASSTAGTCSAR